MREQRDGGCWRLQKRNLRENSISMFDNDNIVVYV